MKETGATSRPPPTSRAEILLRAESWLADSVRYDTEGFHDNEFGSYRTDCSGYVSMAWGLPGRPADARGGLNTVDLTRLAVRLDKTELRAGDAVIAAVGGFRDRHATLFARWDGPDFRTYRAYEHAAGIGTVHRRIPYPYERSSENYRPYRNPRFSQ